MRPSEDSLEKALTDSQPITWTRAGANAKTQDMAKSVLLVEDDDDIREGMSELLQLEGHRVFEASNGQEALTLLEQSEERPGLIVLDLMMPVLDGHGFLARLQNHNNPELRTIPVLIATAGRQSVTTGTTIGYLRKPIDANDLLRFASEHCR